jgi:hypothetical protein
VGSQNVPTFDGPTAIAKNSFQFSMRELLIAFTGFASVLAGYAMGGKFLATLASLVFGIVLIVHGRRTKRTWITLIGVPLLIPSLVVLGFLVFLWYLFGGGPVYSVASYPSDVQQMARLANGNVSDAKVYNLGGFMDTEHVWRQTLSAEQVDRIFPEYRLQPVPVDKVPRTFWKSFPYWWRPRADANCRYWSTADFPATERGPDGNHYFAMYDSQKQWFYVWLKSNF